MPKSRQDAVPLVLSQRGSVIETMHRGHIAVVDTTGRLHWAAGNPAHVAYLRSSAKPFQAITVLESGAFEHFNLTDAQLAVICASHSGEAGHVQTVESILAQIGLTSADLQCGIHPPLHLATAERMLASGQPFTPLHSNCSGKHRGTN